METVDDDIIKAHSHNRYNRAEIEKSDKCGCFACVQVFSPSQISEWISDDRTALCPFCWNDAVIGSASGFPLTHDFLQRMKDYWFASVKVEGFEYKVSRHFLS